MLCETTDGSLELPIAKSDAAPPEDLQGGLDSQVVNLAIAKVILVHESLESV